MFHNHLLNFLDHSRRSGSMKYKGEINRSLKLVMPKVVIVKKMGITELIKSDIKEKQDPMGGDLNRLELTRLEDFSK